MFYDKSTCNYQLSHIYVNYYKSIARNKQEKSEKKHRIKFDKCHEQNEQTFFRYIHNEEIK